MAKRIEAWGNVLEFPDEMPDADIAAAIQKNESHLNPDASTFTKAKSAVSGGIDAGLAMLAPKRSIADRAVESSANSGGLSAPQVKGAPVRRDFYNRMVENPVENAAPGIVSRVRDAAANDTQAQRGKRAVSQALVSGEPVDGEGGFINSAGRTIGQNIKGAGQAAADFIPGVGQDNAVKRFGQDVIDANPTAVNSLEDIADKPGTAVTEATGNAVPSVAGMVGARAIGQGITALSPLAGPAAPVVAAVGQVVSWLGPAAIASLPSYGGIRDKQILNDPANESSAKAKAIAALGAGAVGAIEQSFGPQQWALAAMTKEGRVQLAKKFAATSLPGAIGKGAVKGAAIEGAEEIAQNPIEQLASFDNPTTKENIKDTLFGGAMGAIGGGVLGGGTSAVLRGQPQTDAIPAINGKPVTEHSDNVLKYTANRGSERAKAAAQAELNRRAAEGVDPAVADAPESTSEAVDRIISTGRDKAQEIKDNASSATDAIQSGIFDETSDHIVDANKMVDAAATADNLSVVPDSPTPEPVETLNAQMQALAEGRKPGMLLTPGEPLPNALPEGIKAAEIPSRGTLLYRDDATLQAALNGQMGTAMGYGIDEKPAQPDHVVTARDANGTVIQDVVTDGRPEVQQAAAAVAGPNGTIETRPIESAMAERAGLNSADVVMPDNTALPARWDVVDADSVTASLKEGVSQPRDRSRATSDIQVQGIANSPDYRRLSESPVMDVGAPTLSHDGSIVGGNGRFEGVSRAYDQGSAGEYLANLKADAIAKGIDPAKIDGMKKPVLVRRISQPFDIRKLAIASNSGTGMQYSGLEMAKIDAGRMKGLENLEVTDSGDIALTSSNIQNVRHTLGEYNAAELGSLTDKDGRLSQEGVRRIRNAMLYQAYGSNPTLERLVESTDNDLRNISGALVKAAGSAARVRADIQAGNLPAELDISADVVAAVETLSKIKTQGMSVDEYLAQAGLFGEEVNEHTRSILRVLESNIRSQKKIAEFIKSYYDSVSRIDLSTGDIFGASIPTKQELLNNAKERITEKQPVVQDLFARSSGSSGAQSTKQPANNGGTDGSGKKDQQVTPPPASPKAEAIKADHFRDATKMVEPANLLRPLVESLIKRRAAAKQGGKDLSNAIARAKEAMEGKREPSTVENRWFRLQAKAFERADSEAANILRQIAGAVQGGRLESRVSRTIFDRYAGFGADIVSAEQSLIDAESITGLHLGLPVEYADLPLNVPARFDPARRVIEVSNHQDGFSRSEGAEFMAEELLHAVDALTKDRTLSASSKRLNLQTGDIALEIIGHSESKGTYSKYFEYPLADPDLSDTVKEAELFARLGVLYFGEPKRMRQSLPLAYGAFDGIFSLSSHPVTDEVSRKIWSFTGRATQMGSQHRTNGQISSRSGGSPEVGQRAELERLRAAIRRHFGARIGGGKVDFRRVDDKSFKARLNAYKEKQRAGAEATRSEAGYLIGFKNADELRNRAAKAEIEKRRRRLSKSVQRNQPSDEVLKDEKPKFSRASNKEDFVKSPNGSLDFGQITNEIGREIKRQAAPIRLPRGIQNTDGTGYGLTHIEANHGDLIKRFGFESVEAFVSHVAKDFSQIWQVSGRQLLVAVRSGRQDMMYVQLEPADDGDYYRVNSAFPVRQKDYPERHGFKVLWSGSKPALAVTGKQPAFAANPETSSSQDDPNARGQSDSNIPENDSKFNRSRIDEVRQRLKAVSDKAKQATHSGGLPVSGNRKSSVQSIVDSIRSKWKNSPEIVVVADMNDPAIRKAVRDENERQLSQGATGQPEGFFDQGKVYIVASEMRSPNDVVRVLFHEVLGHAGLRGAFGQELKPILKQIAALRRNDVETKARQYGLDINVEKDRLIAAEEVLAEFSQSRPEISFVRKAIAAIRSWLRKNIPAFSNIEFSDAEIIRNFIIPARGYVEMGLTKSGNTNPVAMKGGANSSLRNIESLASIANSRAFRDHGLRGLKIPEQRIVLSDMVGAIHNNKIRQAVVELIPVDMVHRFAGKKGSPDALLNDPSVLKNILAINSKDSIPAIIDVADSFIRAAAFVTTEDSGASGQGSLSLNRSAAMGASKLNLPAPISAKTGVAAKEILGSGADMVGLAKKRNPAMSAGTIKGRHDVTPDSDVGLGTVAADTASVPSIIPDSTSSIRFSRSTPGNNASWDAPEPSKMDDLIYKLQNKHVDLKRVMEAVRDTGAQIADQWNTYLQEELFHGRAAKRVQDFVNKELKPIIHGMKLRGLTVDELDQYLHARHAEEANKLIAQRDPNMPDGGSGMTNQEAKDYFTNLPADKRKKLDTVAGKVDAVIAKTRDLYLSYGLIDQATHDSWGSMFKHYVPLMREDKDGGMGIGQGFSVKGKETKHRTGSKRAVVDILANIAMQREKVIVRGEKNRVAVSLAGLAKLNPNPDFWTFDKVPTEKVLNEATNQVEERPVPNFKNRDNVVVAKIKDSNGNVIERAVIFNEHDERAMRMAQALKNLDATQLGGLLGVSASITRYFAAINTQYNPVFGIVNLTRDLQASLLNLSSTPIVGHKDQVLKNILPAIRAIYSSTRGDRKGNQATSPMAALWDEMQQEGGMTGYRDLFKTSEDRANAIKRELDPTAWMNSGLGKIFTAGGALKVPLAVAQKMAGWLFDWLSDYNQTLEGAMRLSVYKTAIDNGLSKAQAASIAKNISVNFNRRGSSGQQAGALYAFFNAAMQGTARIGETMTTMEKGDIKTFRFNRAGKAIIAGGITLGVMQALALVAAGFDDDEPPEFVRERSLIIPIGDKKYITVPMPLGFHAIPNIGRLSTEFALGGFKRPADYTAKLFAVFAEAFNPIGNAGLSIQTIAPTAIDPLVALAENRDWTGKPIAKEDFNKLSPTPGFSRNKDTASDPSKWIAEAINTISGGNKYVPGVASPTADQIDYLFGQVTGGVGRESSKLNQSIRAGLTGEDLPPHKIPLVGRFYGDSSGQSSQGNAFYSNLKRINEVEAELKGRRKDRLPIDEFKAENPEYRLVERANLVERLVSKQRRLKSELIEKDAPKEQVKTVEDRITKLMADFNNRIKESTRHKQ